MNKNLILIVDSRRISIRSGQRRQNNVHIRDSLRPPRPLPSGANRQQHLRIRPSRRPRRSHPTTQHDPATAILHTQHEARHRDRALILHPHEVRPGQTKRRPHQLRLQSNPL